MPVKEQMIAWWGPVIYEYYAGTEGNGFCYVTSADWLTHKGTVGRAVIGELRICSEEGEALPPRSEGTVHFANGPRIGRRRRRTRRAARKGEGLAATLGSW